MRLEAVLRQLPNEPLLDTLEAARAKGRNDYPIPKMWSTLLMSFTHQVPSIEALHRHLPSLPPPSSFSRFVTRLIEHLPLLEEMQHTLVHPLDSTRMITFGELIIETSAKRFQAFSSTRRSSLGADYGEKLTYDPKHSNHRLIKWHGYRLHYILDAKSALPLISRVTPASFLSRDVILSLLDQLKVRHPTLLNQCQYTLGDATYDDEILIQALWNRHQIKPLFELVKSSSCSLFTSLSAKKNALYNDLGEVFCTHPRTREKHPMAFAGFEKKRSCLKYRCQASSYGVICKGAKNCTAKKGVRIPLSTNQRLFTPVARSSYKWHGLLSHLKKQEYYCSYLKETLLPKLPFARGLDKLTLYMHLANLTLLANRKK